jgi:hypothetical protein
MNEPKYNGKRVIAHIKSSFHTHDIQSGKKIHINLLKYNVYSYTHNGYRILKLNLKALLHRVLNVCRKLKLRILLKFFNLVL